MSELYAAWKMTILSIEPAKLNPDPNALTIEPTPCCARQSINLGREFKQSIFRHLTPLHCTGKSVYLLFNLNTVLLIR